MAVLDRNASRNLLAEAWDRVHLQSVRDVSAGLAAHNVAYGVGRMLSALRQFDSKGDVSFFGSLDFTVTRHPGRWASGFAYGGLINVESNIPLVFPDFRPNACGTTLGTLTDPISTEVFLDKLSAVRNAYGEEDWDYGRRNHFVNMYQSRTTGQQTFIIHGCPGYQKSDTDEGPGLYVERSQYWLARVRHIGTPLGPVRVLVEDDAQEYWNNYTRCEAVSKEARFQVALEVFDDFDMLSNETHEGMLSIGQYILGCHAAGDLVSQFPLMTNIAQPAYLVSAIETGRDMRFPSNIVSLLPHGTGYDLPIASKLEKVVCDEDGRLAFIFNQRQNAGNQATEVYRDFCHVPYLFRSPNLVMQWEDEGYFEIRDTLLPRVFTKY